MTVESLAREIEYVEADAWASLQASAPAALRDTMGMRVIRHGRAVSLLAPRADVAAINCTIGLGFAHPLTDDELVRILTPYIEAGVERWLIQWSPEAKPASADSLLTRYGAANRGATVKVWRSTDEDFVVPAYAGRIVEIDASRAEEYVSTVADSLGVPATVAPMLAAGIGQEGWHYYLLEEDGRTIAGSAMYVNGSGAWLGLGATIPSARRRGAQMALGARLLEDARRLGCRWVSADTTPDNAEHSNPSYRNMRRGGGRVVYHRPKYLFERAATTAALRHGGTGGDAGSLER